MSRKDKITISAGAIVIAALTVATTILVIKGQPTVKIIRSRPRPEPPKPLTLEEQFKAWKAKLQAQLNPRRPNPPGK